MAVVDQARKSKPVAPTGLVCPKDPKRNESSVDGEGGPTHLAADVVRVDTPDEKKPYRKRATLKCRAITGPATDKEPLGQMCGHEWTVDWPPRT